MVKRSSISCFQMTFPYILGECQELLDEIKARNIQEVWSELMDVYTCTSCWIADRLNVDLPVIENKSTRAWDKRWSWWKEMLKNQGLRFRPWMMKYGSNNEREHKVSLVLFMSRAEKQLT
jgi:hypothetical protein